MFHSIRFLGLGGHSPPAYPSYVLGTCQGQYHAKIHLAARLVDTLPATKKSAYTLQRLHQEADTAKMADTANKQADTASTRAAVPPLFLDRFFASLRLDVYLGPIAPLAELNCVSARCQPTRLSQPL